MVMVEFADRLGPAFAIPPHGRSAGTARDLPLMSLGAGLLFANCSLTWHDSPRSLQVQVF